MSPLGVGDCRGFVVQGDRDRFVITATHCLPHLPLAHGAAYTHKRTYAKLLGPVGAESSGSSP